MLLTDARRAARTAPDGSLVPLAEQDRSTVGPDAIREGIALVEAALPRGAVGPYQLQAAIAAVHDEAPTPRDTDWPQIEALYRMLDARRARPRGHAEPRGRRRHARRARRGAASARAAARATRLRRYHRVHAVRAHLLELRRGRRAGPRGYAAAAELTTSLPEQRYLNERAARLSFAG